MGRKKKLPGKLLTGLRGKLVRVSERLEKPDYPLAVKPHGKAANAWVFTTFLKERVPVVYLFIVEELKHAAPYRHSALQRIIEEWERDSGFHRRPSSRELTAYVIERALGDLWELWGVAPPFTGAEHDSLFRRYVNGNPEAVRALRKALKEPHPWHRHHVGHELRWFLDKPGSAARAYSGLRKAPPRNLPVLSLREEDPRLSRS